MPKNMPSSLRRDLADFLPTILCDEDELTVKESKSQMDKDVRGVRLHLVVFIAFILSRCDSDIRSEEKPDVEDSKSSR